jgi:hypothetical protein
MQINFKFPIPKITIIKFQEFGIVLLPPAGETRACKREKSDIKIFKKRKSISGKLQFSKIFQNVNKPLPDYSVGGASSSSYISASL